LNAQVDEAVTIETRTPEQRSGYLRASERPRCESCEHFEVVIDFNHWMLGCSLGGFEVNRLGICNSWKLSNKPESRQVVARFTQVWRRR
jgi:hypothetical protein